MKKYFQKHYTLAFFIGILAGIFGAIVKWGWEVPFPPRNPNVFWPVDALERVTPPKIFLEQLGLPTERCSFWIFCLSFCPCYCNAFNCRSSTTF